MEESGVVVSSPAERPIQWVQHHDLNAGFCALMTYALNGIRWAEKHDRIPVVNFEGKLNPFFYQPARGDNVWEYYFEPVAELSSGQACDEQRQGRRVSGLSPEQMAFLHHRDPDRIATFWSHDRPLDRATWMAEKRNLGRRYVASYIRVRPEIRRLADAFWDSRVGGRPTLGAHVRGSDFNYATRLSPERYFDLLDQHLGRSEWKDARIFLATDQAQFVDLFSTRYGDRLVTRDCLRSSGELVPLRLSSGDCYERGEEALVDTLLLSRCQHIVKGPAALGEYALWFNADLTCDDLAVECYFDPRTPEKATSSFKVLNLGGMPRWQHRLLVWRHHLSLVWLRGARRAGRMLRGQPRPDKSPPSRS